MRRLFVLFLCLSLGAMLHAANAMVINVYDVYSLNPTVNISQITFIGQVLYVGPDVPGGFQKSNFTVTVSTGSSAAQLQAAAVTAIQNLATSQGYTVSTGHTLLPSYTVQ